MPKRQNLVVYAAMIIADGAWLFTALAILGFLGNQKGSPLPWFAVFGLLALGIFVTRTLANSALTDRATAIVQTGIGIVAIYVAMAASTGAGRSDFDLTWGMRALAGGYPVVTLLGTIIGMFGGVYVWRQAVVVATAKAPEHRLLRSFRAGIATFAVALLVEQASGLDLGTADMLVPFFAACLAGLAVARLRQHSGLGSAWTRVIAASVVATVGLGLALGLLGGLFAQGGVMLVVRGWRYFMDGLFWVVRLILEPLVAGLFALLEWLQESWVTRGQVRETATSRRPSLEWLKTEDGQPLGDAIVDVLQYPAILLTLALMCWILVKVYRGQPAHRRPEFVERRESIEGDSLAALAQMLWAMRPQWMKQARPNTAAWDYPKDEAGITEVFQLYFTTLSLAIERGLKFDPGLTPTERIPHLRRVLPGLSVEHITSLFNAACYGHKRMNSHEIDPLIRQLSLMSDEPSSDPD